MADHKLTSVWNDNGDWCAVYLDGRYIGGGHDSHNAYEAALTELGIELERVTMPDDYFKTYGNSPDNLPRWDE